MKTNISVQLVKVRPTHCPYLRHQEFQASGERAGGSLWAESIEASFSLSPRGSSSVLAALKGEVGEWAFVGLFEPAGWFPQIL